MAIDVSRFHQTFFEESLEGLELMEAGLLELEEGSDDNDAINTIFRAAHSIKGGAGTLGFTAMADFTHLLETILDRRRSGKGEVTQETIDVLLGSVDVLRDMLATAQGGDDLDADRIAEVEGRLQELVDRDSAPAAEATDDAAATPTTEPPAGNDPSAAPAANEVVTDPDSVEAASEWQISFKPLPHLFRTGNDPVRILGELAELGTYTAVVDLAELPDLEALDIEFCHMAWAIELKAAEGGEPIERATITQIFEWVEDDAEIHVTPLGFETPAEAAETPKASASDQAADTAASTQPNNAEAAKPERRTGSPDRRQDGGAHPSASIRVDIEKVDTLINMVGELVITQSMLQQVATQGNDMDFDKLREGLAELESNTRELQGSVMQIRMLPISFAFSRLPRLVRDLASKFGKKIDLQIHGETTELDKTVMEKIGDPLVHLVRNALDHGVEMPEARVAAGKPETGIITLDAYHEGGNIVIEIVDDGAGIDAARITAKARDRGLIPEDEQLTDKQAHDLIFHPGFSTADVVSDVSGRGVGMDVVKRNITDLGGVVEVVSVLGKGTTFRIRLPLTLAILDGQVVRVGDQVFIVPLVSIVESLQFDRTLTSSLTKGANVYRHRGEAIPLIGLGETMNVGPDDATHDPMLVIVEADGARAALIVDELLAQQQIVIKSLTTNFRAVPGLSGATILGDGTVAMIIDINSVLSLYRKAAPTANRAA